MEDALRRSSNREHCRRREVFEYRVRHGKVGCSEGATQQQTVTMERLEACGLAWTHTLTSKVLLETSVGLARNGHCQDSKRVWIMYDLIRRQDCTNVTISTRLNSINCKLTFLKLNHMRPTPVHAEPSPAHPRRPCIPAQRPCIPAHELDLAYERNNPSIHFQILRLHPNPSSPHPTPALTHPPNTFPNHPSPFPRIIQQPSMQLHPPKHA
jgi:hypothetical protein